jgi:hypothetical protein
MPESRYPLNERTLVIAYRFNALRDYWLTLVECVECAEWTDDFSASSEGDVCTPCLDESFVYCDDCEEYVRNDDSHSVQSGETVCDSCIGNYSFCNDCEEYVGMYDVVEVGWDHYVCESCREGSYGYCDGCDSYYHYDNGGCENDGCQDCDCESPVQSFTIRNDGNDPLANDTRTTINLPAGEISEEGLEQIRRLIQSVGSSIVLPSEGYNPATCDYSDEWKQAREEQIKWFQLARNLEGLGGQWQSKEGNYTKRLSRLAYKQHGLKVPPHVISEVGNIGSANSGGVNHNIEVTRNLNLSAYDFGHEDSCFWQSYFSSRCTLKSEGGFGIRSFNPGGGQWGNSVTGRAWVFPLKQENGALVPTFNTETPDAFVVFNGYGDLGGYTGARIMSHMAGMTYRKVTFYADPIYVNSEAGYLVAPEEIAKNYTDGTLSLPTSDHSDLYRQEQIEGLVA